MTPRAAGGGRTSWWPCDAAEHDRELVVELAEEFGPVAHAVTRILKDLAQAQRSDGSVLTGFRVVAAKTHLAVIMPAADARALARTVVERAGEIGWLDDLEIDADGRRFTCRVSGWAADQARGRAAIKKAAQRDADSGHVPVDGDTDAVVPLGGDNAPETPPVVPFQGDVSGSVPPTPSSTPIPNREGTKEQPRTGERANASDGSTAGERQDSPHRVAEEITGMLQRGIDGLTGDARCKPPTVATVLAALTKHPVSRESAIAAAVETRATAQSQNRAPNIVGLFEHKLASRSVGARVLDLNASAVA